MRMSKKKRRRKMGSGNGGDLGGKEDGLILIASLFDPYMHLNETGF